MFPLAMRALGLLATGALLGLLVNGVRADGVRFASFAAPSVCTMAPAGSARPAGPAPVELLAPRDAAGLCGDARTLIADVRSAADFAEGHVSGAIHLPCTASGEAAGAAVDMVAGRQTLVVYGTATDDARRVAEELRQRIPGRDLRIVVVSGGFGAWSQAGLACSSGPCVHCGAPGSGAPVPQSAP
jgi:rhodanese-related sulfurtransferase